MALLPVRAGGLIREQAVLPAQLRYAIARALARARRAFCCLARASITRPTAAVRRAAALRLNASVAAVPEAGVCVALAGVVAGVADLSGPALSVGDALDAELLSGAYTRRARCACAGVHAGEVRTRAAIPALADARALGGEAGPTAVAEHAAATATRLTTRERHTRVVRAAVRAWTTVGVGQAGHAQALGAVTLGQVRRAFRSDGAAGVLSVEDALPGAAVELSDAVAAQGAAALAGVADIAGDAAATALVWRRALAAPVEALLALQAGCAL